MADTIADVTATAADYVSLNTLTSIAVGTALVITNKSNDYVYLQIAATKPAATSRAGELLAPLPSPAATKLLTAGGNALWARASGGTDALLTVQDNT